MSMQSILTASQSMSRMQTMQSARTQMQGKANILRIESQQDGGNKKKDAKAEELENESIQLLGDLFEESGKINETLKPETDTEVKESEEKEESTQSTEKDGKTDTVTFSAVAEGYRGALPQISPVTDEIGTYRPDGSRDSSLLAKSGSTVEVTA